jgi:hypothetical protein
VICGGVIAALWIRVESQRDELGRTRAELSSAIRLVEAKPPQVHIVTERSSPAFAPAAPTRDDSSRALPSPEATDPGEVGQASPEEQGRIADARFAHIQGIFAAQKASDFEPERARALEREVSPALGELVKQRKSIELGAMECRGRMCGVDVVLADPTDAASLDSTVRLALMKHEGQPPLVHLVTRAGDQAGKHAGRLYFEWLPPQGNPAGED